MTHPVDTLIADGVAVSKSAFRSFTRARSALVMESATEVQNADLSGQQVIVLKSNGRTYALDTGDTTSAHNGTTVLVDSEGHRFKLIVIDGLDGVDGNTIIGADAEPATTYPAGSLWIDTDSADLDLYELSGSPLEWTDTGVNLKGTAGADGSDPGVLLNWDTGTSDANPGAGNIRANNADLSAATTLYISKTSRGGSDISAFLTSLDDSTNTVKGTLALTETASESQATFLVGAVTDASDYIKLAISGHSGETSFSDEEPISFQFSRAGNVGGGLANVVEDTTPQLGGVLDTNGHQVRWSKGADVASANALTLGDDGNYFDITGTTAITSIGTKAVGTVVKLHFDGALTLTHNAADLILPGGANITTAAGDEAEFVEYATGDWRCTKYARASGKPIVPNTPAEASALGQGVHEIWIDASAMKSAASNGAAIGAYATGEMIAAAFDASTDESVYFKIGMPKGWNNGTVSFIPYWTNAAGLTTETVSWNLEGRAMGNDDAINTTFGTPQESEDTWIAQNDLHIGPESAAITIGNTPAENDLVSFRLYRDVSEDNLTGDALLLGIKLRVTIDMPTDA